MTTEAKADTPSAASSSSAAAELKKDESGVALMTEGRTFTYYYTENDVVNKKELFVYYDATEGKLGSLLWCEAGKREKIAGQAVPLHYISDVYLGKQTPELQSPLAADASSDRCFSIISKEKNVSLHLGCESPSLRNSFLQGIKEIFSRASSAKTPLQIMSKGAPFQYFFTGTDAQVAKKEIFLWFDQSEGKLGSLLWNDAGKKEKITGQIIPLHHISDVFMGKQCPELKSPLASDVLSNQCFSIKSKEIQLNLVASNEKARELWLAGIKEVFTQNANQKKQKQAAAAAAAAIANNTNNATTTSAATAPVAASDAAGAPKETETVADAAAESKPDASTQTNSTNNPSEVVAAPVATVVAAEKIDEKPVEKPSEEAAASPTPAPSAAPVAASITPIPALSSSSDRDALAILTDGLKLSSYSGSPSSSKEIFLFYDNDQPKLGALYWNDETKNREKIAANSILLHKISDVFMGKQSAELKGVSAASTLCFSVAEKSGKSLHLVAQSEKDRKDVLDGIKMIFQKAGKKVDDGKKPTPATNGNNTNAVPVAAAPLPVPAPFTSGPSYDNLLEKGGVFTLYSSNDGKVSAKKIFVFVDFSDEKFGALYYCDEGKREKIKEQTLPLHLICDVFLGKTSTELKSEAAANVSPNECFSLHTKVRAIHLSASSTLTRQSWLDSIRNVFVSRGKRVEDEKPKKPLTVNTSVAAAAAAADLASPSSPGAVHISGRALNDPLIKGVDINGYFTESSGVVRRRLHIWFVKEDGKYGTLYWNDDGKKEKNPSKSIPFHLITDVYIGKKTPELSSSIANALPSNVCFGIKAKNNSISCETANEAQRNELVNAVKSVFASVGKQVQEASKVSPPKTGKDLLIHGQSFHGYFSIDSDTVRKSLWLFYAADDQKMGTLYWSDKEGDRSKSDANSMALHKISDVFLGKQANEFRSAAAVAAPNDHCLSVKTKRIALHLEAKSTADRNNWLNALRSIFTNGGKSVVEDDSLRIAKKAAAQFAVGDHVSTPYGNGIVSAPVRSTDGIIAVQTSFGIIHSHFKEVKKAVSQENGPAATPITPAPAAAHAPIHVNTTNASAPPAAAAVSIEATPVSTPAAVAPSVAIAASVDVSAPVSVPAVAPASPSSVYDDPSLVTDSVRLRAIMETGHLFTGYSMKGDRVITKRMTLWLSTDSDGDTYLYWTPEGAAKVADIDQGVDVEEIIDVKLGKQSPLFTTVPALAHLDADCCLSIISEQFSVELVADSPKISKAWVVAIRKVSPKLKL